jgi:hypothetical protein
MAVMEAELEDKAITLILSFIWSNFINRRSVAKCSAVEALPPFPIINTAFPCVILSIIKLADFSRFNGLVK